MVLPRSVASVRSRVAGVLTGHLRSGSLLSCGVLQDASGSVQVRKKKQKGYVLPAGSVFRESSAEISKFPGPNGHLPRLSQLGVAL